LQLKSAPAAADTTGMTRYWTALLLAFCFVMFAGCNNDMARHSDGKAITVKIKDKKHNLMGDSEAHTDWVIVTDKGKFNPYYRAFGELDMMGRSKLYKELKEGHSYRCRKVGKRHGLNSYPVLKDCTEVPR
jgi:hypothetical protein